MNLVKRIFCLSIILNNTLFGAQASQDEKATDDVQVIYTIQRDKSEIEPISDLVSMNINNQKFTFDHKWNPKFSWITKNSTSNKIVSEKSIGTVNCLVNKNEKFAYISAFHLRNSDRRIHALAVVARRLKAWGINKMQYTDNEIS